MVEASAFPWICPAKSWQHRYAARGPIIDEREAVDVFSKRWAFHLEVLWYHMGKKLIERGCDVFRSKAHRKEGCGKSETMLLHRNFPCSLIMFSLKSNILFASPSCSLPVQQVAPGPDGR